MLKTLRLIAVVLMSVFEFSEACNGYTVTLDYARVCSNINSIAKPVGFAASLDKDCNVVLNGCVETSKPIKYSKGTYFASKPPLPELSGDLDVCDVIEHGGPLQQIDDFVSLLNLPKKCPVDAKKYCISPKKNKISISAFKTRLAMGVGTTTVKIDVGHDTGKSCVEFAFTLHKPRKG